MAESINTVADTIPQVPDDRYKVTMYGIGRQTMLRSFLSPHYYSGVVSHISSSGFRYTKKGIEARAIIFNVGTVSRTENSMAFLNLEYIYSRNYKSLKSWIPEKILITNIGWAIWSDNEISLKSSNVNNPIYLRFNVMPCLSIVSKFQKKKFRFLNEFYLPVAGLFVTSEYGSILPVAFSEKDTPFHEGFKVTSFGGNFQLANRISADVKLWKRTCRFQYEVQYQSLRINNVLSRTVSHIFKFGFLFNKVYYVHK